MHSNDQVPHTSAILMPSYLQNTMTTQNGSNNDTHFAPPNIIANQQMMVGCSPGYLEPTLAYGGHNSNGVYCAIAPHVWPAIPSFQSPSHTLHGMPMRYLPVNPGYPG